MNVQSGQERKQHESDFIPFCVFVCTTVGGAIVLGSIKLNNNNNKYYYNYYNNNIPPF